MTGDLVAHVRHDGDIETISALEAAAGLERSGSEPTFFGEDMPKPADIKDSETIRALAEAVADTDIGTEAFTETLANLQAAIGVVSGDAAGHFFSGLDTRWGPMTRDHRFETVRQYVAFEVALAEESVTAETAGFLDEAPDFPVAHWRRSVSDGETRLGYWDWVRDERACA
ncbi:MULTISPECIES: hypothetical protein [unclassified Thioalkalivibrio]|uniref:hypothetical protein n=1 Tax=unclassified Thioalkalivibrio TaxID=2621013 RepID=UPI001E52FE0B|nr:MULTISPECIES: hypothetical protein [unclassified Thioalkalivibrio]